MAQSHEAPGDAAGGGPVTGLRARAGGWGYAINYDREIANDLAEIALFERHLPLIASLTETERAWPHLTIQHWLMASPALRAPLLNLTDADIVDLAEFWERSAMGDREPPPGWYGRASKLERQLDKDFGAYVLKEAPVGIRKIKTRLARHRRNQKKWTSA